MWPAHNSLPSFAEPASGVEPANRAWVDPDWTSLKAPFLSSHSNGLQRSRAYSCIRFSLHHCFASVIPSLFFCSTSPLFAHHPSIETGASLTPCRAIRAVLLCYVGGEIHVSPEVLIVLPPTETDFRHCAPWQCVCADRAVAALVQVMPCARKAPNPRCICFGVCSVLPHSKYLLRIEAFPLSLPHPTFLSLFPSVCHILSVHT